MLNSMQVTLDLELHKHLGTALIIRVEIQGEGEVQVKRIIPDNDFESRFDYVWDACKQLLDNEIKKNLA